MQCIKTEKFYTGQDSITYLALILKVNVIVTSFYMRRTVIP